MGQLRQIIEVFSKGGGKREQFSFIKMPIQNSRRLLVNNGYFKFDLLLDYRYFLMRGGRDCWEFLFTISFLRGVIWMFLRRVKFKF